MTSHPKSVNEGKRYITDPSGKFHGTLFWKKTKYTKEQWDALTERQRHGLDLPDESPRDEVGFETKSNSARFVSGAVAAETVPLEAPVFKVAGGTDVPKSASTAEALQAVAPVGSPFRQILEAFARTCDGVTGKAALCGYGEGPETDEKLRHHIVHVLNDGSFVGRACAAVREIASVPGRNVYFPAGLINIDVPDNGNERGKEGSVVGRWCIPLEFDKGGHTAMNVASRLPLPAQFLIQSSVQGIHILYVLDRLYTVAETQPVVDALVKALGSDPACKGATYVFGLPGTTNWPKKSKREEYAQLGITRVPEVRQAITRYTKSEPVTLAELEAAARKMYPEAFDNGHPAPINSSSSPETEFDWVKPDPNATSRSFKDGEALAILDDAERYPKGSRKKGAYRFVATCKDRGYTPSQTLELMTEHRNTHVMTRYWGKSDVDPKKLRSDVKRVWKKITVAQRVIAVTPSKIFRLDVDQPNGAPQKRAVIQVSGGSLPVNIEQAEQALIVQRVSLFVRGDMIVRPCSTTIENADGRTSVGTRLFPISAGELAVQMTATAEWERWDARSGEMKPINCPKAVAEVYLDRAGMWKLRRLNGIINTPTLRADGSLLDRPGYDPQTGLIYDPLGVAFPKIAAHPSKPEALAALELLKSLIEEAPFVSDVARSVALSMMLTALVRRTLPTAPLHAVSAHMAGSGKSYLADIAATIATGIAAPVFSQGANDEEFEKRLVVNLMFGDAVTSIDNCDRPLSGAFLNMVLTQPMVRARILGQSKTVEMPSNVFVLATGNNLRVKEDMTRRVLISQIDPKRENPELRVFKKDPVATIQRNRARYVMAGLTVLRAYEAARRPARQSPLGSFEAWSLLVRDALIWLGEADPVESQEGARANDPSRQYLRAVLTQWRRVFGSRPVRASEVVSKAATDAELQEVLAAVAAPFARSAEMIDARRLGEYLRARKGEIVGGLSIQDAGERGGSNLWALQIQ